MISSQKIKHLLIINGVQFKKDLTTDPEFIARLNKAIELANQSTNNKAPIDAIIISGGLTRKDCPSEASFGEQYLKKQITTQSIPIFKEEESHTTIENIKFTKNLIEKIPEFDLNKIEQITIVTTPGRLPRLKYLYKKLWPETQSKTEFVVASYPQNFLLPFTEFLYLIYSVFDIHEKSLARFTKRILRNRKS